VIDARNAVSRKEQDPLVVLKLGEKNFIWLVTLTSNRGVLTLTRDELVPREGVVRPSAKEDICLIEK
jgi:hypothetical protein